jgi:hypothetical protein
MSRYHAGGSTARLRHISEDQAVQHQHSSVANISISSGNATQSSFGSTVLSHIPPAVVAAEGSVEPQATETVGDASLCSVFPTPPNSQQEKCSQSPEKYNTNSNNVLSHPPPLIRHVESHPADQPSLETTSRLSHVDHLSVAPPQLIPILKSEPETMWHATPNLNQVPWPHPPNAKGEVGEGSGIPEPSGGKNQYNNVTQS